MSESTDVAPMDAVRINTEMVIGGDDSQGVQSVDDGLTPSHKFGAWVIGPHSGTPHFYLAAKTVDHGIGIGAGSFGSVHANLPSGIQTVLRGEMLFQLARTLTIEPARAR